MSKWTCFLLIVIMITGCKNENELFNNHNEHLNPNENVSMRLISGGALMGVSYEITSYTRYHYDFEKLTELDIAHLNPSDEKQRVQIFLMQDGTVNMVIEEMDFERRINIPHEIEPSDLPKIRRTEVIGNNITFYDGNRKALDSHSTQMQKRTELANRIKQLGDSFGYSEAVRCFAEIQGGFSDHATIEMIDKARSRGQLTEHCERYVTVRTNLSEFMRDATGTAVMIVDKDINKVVAVETCDEKENITSRTYYGYEQEGEPLLNATRTDQKMEVPSGAEVWQTTMSKIENLKFNLTTDGYEK